MVFVYLALVSVFILCTIIECKNRLFQSSESGHFHIPHRQPGRGGLSDPTGLNGRVKVSYLGLPFIPALWCLCILEFCGLNAHKTKRLIAFLPVPVIMTVLAFTWQSNHLLFTEASYLETDQYGQLRFTPGPLYFIKPLYFCLVDIVGVIVILLTYKSGTRRFKRQAIYFFISALIPVFVTGSYLVETDTSWFDLTPYGTTLASALFLFAHSRYGIKNAAVAIKNRVVDGLHEGVIIFYPGEIHVDSNKVAKQLFPERAHVRLGEAITEMAYLPFNSSTLRQDESSLLEYSKEIDGLPRTYNLSIARMIQGDKVQGYCIITHNITTLKSAMGDLETRAYTDSLTGLFNRSYFFEKAHSQVRLAKEAGTPLSVIMFDLDHFKRVNDTYGHACGDYVLKTVASLAGSLVRKNRYLGPVWRGIILHTFNRRRSYGGCCQGGDHTKNHLRQQAGF